MCKCVDISARCTYQYDLEMTRCLLSGAGDEMGSFIRLLHVHGPYVCVQSKRDNDIKQDQPRKVSAFLPRTFLAGAALGSR